MIVSVDTIQCHNKLIILFQAKRDVFWDTSPHYGGARGSQSGVLSILLRHYKK